MAFAVFDNLQTMEIPMVSIVFVRAHVVAVAKCAVAHSYWLNELMATENLDPLNE